MLSNLQIKNLSKGERIPIHIPTNEISTSVRNIFVNFSERIRRNRSWIVDDTKLKFNKSNKTELGRNYSASKHPNQRSLKKKNLPLAFFVFRFENKSKFVSTLISTCEWIKQPSKETTLSTSYQKVYALKWFHIYHF